MHLEIV